MYESAAKFPQSHWSTMVVYASFNFENRPNGTINVYLEFLGISMEERGLGGVGREIKPTNQCQWPSVRKQPCSCRQIKWLMLVMVLICPMIGPWWEYSGNWEGYVTGSA